MKTEIKSNILLVRDLEDTIRATRKYTKGAFSKASKHPQKIQGEEFPSRVLTEYYEVYPDLEVGWDMRAGDAWAWVWGDVVHIDVVFLYDYRENKAKVTIHGGKDALEKLKEGIPGFQAILVMMDRFRAARAASTKATTGGEKAADNGQTVNTNTSLQTTIRRV